jgi:hypothetical protein
LTFMMSLKFLGAFLCINGDRFFCAQISPVYD